MEGIEKRPAEPGVVSEKIFAMDKLVSQFGKGKDAPSEWVDGSHPSRFVDGEHSASRAFENVFEEAKPHSSQAPVMESKLPNYEFVI